MGRCWESGRAYVSCSLAITIEPQDHSDYVESSSLRMSIQASSTVRVMLAKSLTARVSLSAIGVRNLRNAQSYLITSARSSRLENSCHGGRGDYASHGSKKQLLHLKDTWRTLDLAERNSKRGLSN